jgi:hypothetical protein
MGKNKLNFIDFPKENEINAVNLLIYGVKIKRFTKNLSSCSYKLFYIHEDSIE